MASLGHVAVGFAAARWRLNDAPGARWPALPALLAWSAWSLAPDLDVVAFALRVPYEAPWGHRGATHSLAFAVMASAVMAAVMRAVGHGAWKRDGVLLAAVMASHGLLDALTDGGLGCALLWPMTDARYFLPVQPIPVAPIGAGFVSARGMYVAAVELVMFLPAWAYALWPRRS